MSHAPHPTPRPEATVPHSEYFKDGRLKIVIVGLDKNIRPQAKEVADDKLLEKRSQGGFKGFINRIWYGTYGKETFLARATQQAQQEIVEHNNLQYHEGGNDEADRLATTRRFVHEYDELIHEDVGEHRGSVEELDDENGERLKDALHDLIDMYAQGKFDDADDPARGEQAFQEEKKRIITLAVRDGITEDQIGEGLLYADNLLQIAQNVRSLINAGHFQNTEEAMANADITLGEAKIGARTEIVQRNSERIAEKLNQLHVPYLNEATIATGAAIAYTVGGYAVQRGVQSALATVAPGIAGGAFAGMREASMLKEERAAAGRKIEKGADVQGLRAELGETYHVEEGDELLATLGDVYNKEGHLPAGLGELRLAASRVAFCRATIRLADEGRILLVLKDEQQRFELDLALAKAERDVASAIDGMSEEDQNQFVYFDHEDDDVGAQYNERHSEEMEEFIDARAGTKEALYRKMRNKRVAMAAVKGALIGAGVGLVLQEAAAFASSDRQGLIEGMMGHDEGAHQQTALANLLHPHDEQYPNMPQLHLSGDTQPIQLGENSDISLPSEFKVVHTGNTLSITGPGGVHLDRLSLTPDGHLTQQAEATLQKAGFTVSAEHGVDVTTVKQHITVSPEQFLKNHPGLSTDVVRDFWYQGDSQGLSYQAGPNGSYVLHVGGLNSELTSANGTQMSLQQAAEQGDIKVAISLSNGTQSQVIMVPVDAQGNAVIPAHSQLAEFFHNDNGTIEFKGQYVEVVQDAGKDANGITHIRPIATGVGEGDLSFGDTQSVQEFHPTTDYKASFTPAAPHTFVHAAEPLVGVPPVAPLYMYPSGSPSGRGARVENSDGGVSDDEADEEEVFVVPKAKVPEDVLDDEEAEDEEEAKPKPASAVAEKSDAGAPEKNPAAKPATPTPEATGDELGERIDALQENDLLAAQFDNELKFGSYHGLIRLVHVNEARTLFRFARVNPDGARVDSEDVRLGRKALRAAFQSGALQVQQRPQPEHPEVANETPEEPIEPETDQAEVVAATPQPESQAEASGERNERNASAEHRKFPRREAVRLTRQLVPGSVVQLGAQAGGGRLRLRAIDIRSQDGAQLHRFEELSADGTARPNQDPDSLVFTTKEVVNAFIQGDFTPNIAQAAPAAEASAPQTQPEAVPAAEPEVIEEPQPEQQVEQPENNGAPEQVESEPAAEAAPPAPSPESESDPYASIRRIPRGTYLQERQLNGSYALMQYDNSDGDTFYFEPVDANGRRTGGSTLVMSVQDVARALSRSEFLPLPYDHPLRRKR